jgi:hypothetical protein
LQVLFFYLLHFGVTSQPTQKVWWDSSCLWTVCSKSMMTLTHLCWLLWTTSSMYTLMLHVLQACCHHCLELLVTILEELVLNHF